MSIIIVSAGRGNLSALKLYICVSECLKTYFAYIIKNDLEILWFVRVGPWFFTPFFSVYIMVRYDVASGIAFIFVTSKSALFTTFLISIAFYVNTYASANRTFVFCSF